MKHIEITCIADPRDVLSVKTEAKVDLIESVYKRISEKVGEGKAFIINKAFNSLNAVLVTDKNISFEEIENIIISVSKEYSTKDFRVSIEEASETRIREIKEKLPEMPADITKSAVKEPVDKPTESRIQEEKKNDGDEEEISPYDNILSLVGMDELKIWADEVENFAKICPSENVLQKILMSMSYLVSIDQGSGCTTLLNCMGKLLLKYLPKEKLVLREYSLIADGENKNLNNVQGEIREIKDNEKLYIFALHMDKIQSILNTDRWTEFLETCWDRNNSAIFIFIVPVLENIVLSSIHDNINDLLSNKVIRIQPMTNDDYICFFEKFFSQYNVKVDSSAHGLFLDKIAEEKNDGKFHGINTVNKVCEEILYYKFRNTSNIDAGLCIVKEDIAAVLAKGIDETDESGYERLENLVSLDNVKKKVKEIVASVKMNKKINSGASQSMHMMFGGAPGTGKTEVARIIGKIFREENLLSKGGFYEVTRKDLVGQYVGHTAPKTAAVCRDAYGSVLFIDEAYMLDGGSDNDYGKEAISTLIAEMENNRDKLIVIFAGYTKELERLFQLNPGLRDRIPYRIQFENYSKEELIKIFYTKIPKRFTYTEEFKKSVEKYFMELPNEVFEDENFSNARFVRNVMERTLSKAALRMQSNSDNENILELVESDFELAVSDTEFRNLNEKKRSGQIGFRIEDNAAGN